MSGPVSLAPPPLMRWQGRHCVMKTSCPRRAGASDRRIEKFRQAPSMRRGEQAASLAASGAASLGDGARPLERIAETVRINPGNRQNLLLFRCIDKPRFAINFFSHISSGYPHTSNPNTDFREVQDRRVSKASRGKRQAVQKETGCCIQPQRDAAGMAD